MPAHLSAEPGKVILEVSNGAGLDLSPANARVWAERLAAMADVAEALEREGGRG
jgi:antitoxin component of MazEF toxin-antitoxin module